ncbi:MarR family transcriptional regulator [Paenibacillus sp. P26]|nr:MarR family transcriptional regulator [Paenibacillus sp. P26]UUZ97459.1 MarR family transcriptional regulator [Paenibacillus sp. P25]
MTGPQVMMLYTIQRERPCQVTKLAQMMEVKPSAITVMIDRLVQHGFVSRTHDVHDRRVVLLEMTERGKEILEEIRRMRFKAMGLYLSQLEAEELTAFINTFEKLAEQINK